MPEKWIVGDKGGPMGPFYSVVSQQGRLIAGKIVDQGMAHLIAQLPHLKELRYEWSIIINRLANIALDADSVSSNDRDFCQDMIEMALPFLDGAMLVE